MWPLQCLPGAHVPAGRCTPHRSLGEPEVTPKSLLFGSPCLPPGFLPALTTEPASRALFCGIGGFFSPSYEKAQPALFVVPMETALLPSKATEGKRVCVRACCRAWHCAASAVASGLREDHRVQGGGAGQGAVGPAERALAGANLQGTLRGTEEPSQEQREGRRGPHGSKQLDRGIKAVFKAGNRGSVVDCTHKALCVTLSVSCAHTGRGREAFGGKTRAIEETAF